MTGNHSVSMFKEHTEAHIKKLETEQLKRKTLFVNVVLALLIAPMGIALYNYGSSVFTMLAYVLVFATVVTINTIFLRFPKVFGESRLPMHITILALYVIFISLVVELRSPGVFTMLFVAYAVVALYQERSATIMNNVLVFVVGVITVLGFGDMFRIIGVERTQVIDIVVFLFIFTSLLSLTTSVLLKRKRHYLSQVSAIKEDEARALEIVTALKAKYRRTPMKHDDYYRQVAAFSEALAEKIGMKNVFSERIELMKYMHEKAPSSEMPISKETGESSTRLSMDEVNQMLIKPQGKLHYIMYKASQLTQGDDNASNTESLRQFPSLKHTFDCMYTRIVALSAFIVIMHTDKPYLEGLSTRAVVGLLRQTETSHLVDNDLLGVLQENTDVVEQLIERAFKKGGRA